MNNYNLITEKFWDNKHETNNIDSLSGCGYNETINFLKIKKYIKNNIKVLEVGVGMGYVTKGLFENNIIVSAVDISEIALKRINNYCENTYSEKNINNLPSNYFDVIICNNVVQHIPTDLLLIELKEIMRSLKKSGVLAIEFVSSEEFEDNGININYEDIISGRLCRTTNYLESIFKKFGGKCELVFDKKININFLKGHHVFHVTK